MCSKTPTRKLSETRRIRKPLMEKKRRARINDSLEELKSLVIEAKKEDLNEVKPSKMEKADILELTVQHVKSLHGEKKGTESYKEGFRDCAEKVRALIEGYENLAPSSKGQLLAYLFSRFGHATPKLTLLPAELGTNGDLAFLFPSNLNTRYTTPKLANISLAQDQSKRDMWRPW